MRSAKIAKTFEPSTVGSVCWTDPTVLGNTSNATIEDGWRYFVGGRLPAIAVAAAEHLG
jgi:hypothetical protein